MPSPILAVEPHGDLQPIFDDAWYVTGSVSFKPLVRLVRNMVVLRHEGELTVVNSVRLNAQGEAALDALGKVAHIMKIGGHGMDDAYYVDRYKAKLWAADPQGGATELTEATELPLPGVKVFRFRDTLSPEAALHVERDGGLLITCDSVQHWVPHPLMSMGASIITSLMGFKNPAQIGPPWRKIQTPPGGSLRDDFDRLVSLPFDRLIGGHGGLLESGASRVLGESIERTFG
ncbi:MAG: hypothetical protein JKY37_33940 [Nannocystaceae bacterium]|nr:hypothetical protein [Nannocystaceae bacterium]